MRALVTGAAGFIGSSLTEHLLATGWSVRGVDCFTPYYDPAVKRANVAAFRNHPKFTLVEADLLSGDVGVLLDDVDVVFHLSGQPGVRLSWEAGFQTYVDANITVTQRLLEAARGRSLHRFVYASSSSVYGNVSVVPTGEAHPARPFSPYGVTKLAGELLCGAYGANFGVPTASVRYFTVYGPRQRPEMALHRLIEASLRGDEFPLFGDGSQVRDFTYVDDIVRATVAAAEADIAVATVVNAAGGGSVTLRHLIELVESATGRPLRLDHRPAQPGDVEATGGDISLAATLLGWAPQVSLAEGVERQVAWHLDHRR